MQVSYRGTITETTTANYNHSYSFSDNKQQAAIKLELSPNERGKGAREKEGEEREYWYIFTIHFNFTKGGGNVFDVRNKAELQEQLRMTDEQLSELIESVKQGVESAWQRGVPPGFVVDDIPFLLPLPPSPFLHQLSPLLGEERCKWAEERKWVNW
jgi:translation elongation factor EF-G